MPDEGPLKLGIHGAAGRMGLRLVALAARNSRWKLSAAYEDPRHPQMGADVGVLAGVGPLAVPLTDHVSHRVDVIIDFSIPAASLKLLEVCEERQIPLVIATTGFKSAEKECIASAAQVIPVVFSPSMSFAVNVAMKLASDAARALSRHPQGVDVEIIEKHHRFKLDAPSGTALKFGEMISQVLGTHEQRHGRQGETGPRPPQEIGYHAIRAGDIVGEHTVLFGLMGETLEVTVRSQSRDSYAHGALVAAEFAATHPPGLYTMVDVLGL